MTWANIPDSVIDWHHARDAFPGYGRDPVNIDGDPEHVLKLLLGDEVTSGADYVVEPVLDD